MLDPPPIDEVMPGDTAESTEEIELCRALISVGAFVNVALEFGGNAEMDNLGPVPDDDHEPRGDGGGWCWLVRVSIEGRRSTRPAPVLPGPDPGWAGVNTNPAEDDMARLRKWSGYGDAKEGGV